MGGWWRALVALLAVAPAKAVELPGDRAEALLHAYDGGGIRAVGPALLVRKTMKDRVAFTGQIYVDMVSNASVDVVSTASPFRETRTAVDLGVETVWREALLKLAVGQSSEPDYRARSLAVDLSQDFFGGMSTLALGFTRGADDVGKKGVTGPVDRATHWQHRVGLTQVLGPRWLASLNLEALADHGLLGSPYRAARVFGAAVPERLPRTRSARALRLGTQADLERLGGVLRGEWRLYRDTWGVQAHTLELGHARDWRPQGWPPMQVDAALRLHRQRAALFYSDDAASETRYVTRNRQLSSFGNWGLAAKARVELPRPAGSARWWLLGSYEFKRFSYRDFTDPRTGQAYAHNAHVLQLHVASDF
ncbi:MAG: DUF3570 domain-containing protein [Rubrivivax sp.]|nr:DUF3570 domain-containing protein [Rubrivivax sp.]